MIKNCYIHIPFCDNICSYCDFCKVYYNKVFVEKYLDILEKEINSIYKREELETIYIGGGTPSCLTIDELTKLFEILSKLKRSSNYEYTIECNFESTTKEKLDLYKKYGVNRLSFGIESIDNNNLDIMGRKFSKTQAEEILNYSKKIGIKNINVDLIYALPRETIEVLKKDLDYVLSLDIPHISTYSLMIENNTMIYIKGTESISEDLDYEMYSYICKTLNENGFNHYEISNFSKVGYESKHNNCYWENKEYYGFGVGASYYIEYVRGNNTKSISKYLKNEIYGESEQLTLHDNIEYEIILNLRKQNGIDLEKFEKKYNVALRKLYNYDKLIKEKLLIKKGNNISIAENKWYISNEIIIRLLGCELK